MKLSQCLVMSKCLVKARYCEKRTSNCGCESTSRKKCGRARLLGVLSDVSFGHWGPLVGHRIRMRVDCSIGIEALGQRRLDDHIRAKHTNLVYHPAQSPSEKPSRLAKYQQRCAAAPAERPFRWPRSRGLIALFS